MGTISACLAYCASNFDPVFAFAIMVAQFFSVVTAGVTGTFAPLVFTFICNRDPGKRGGPLETAIQDIVGSFALMFLSYKILEFFGPLDIDPNNDMCGEIKS
jgi:Mg/Co/Ni transporter MgtE